MQQYSHILNNTSESYLNRQIKALETVWCDQCLSLLSLLYGGYREFAAVKLKRTTDRAESDLGADLIFVAILGHLYLCCNNDLNDSLLSLCNWMLQCRLYFHVVFSHWWWFMCYDMPFSNKQMSQTQTHTSCCAPSC